MKTLLSSKIGILGTAVLLGGIFVTASYFYALESVHSTIEGKVRSNIIKWNHEFAEKIYKKNDLDFVQKKIDDLLTHPISSYSVGLTGKESTFKWPKKDSYVESCRVYSEPIYLFGGIQAGSFNFCISKSRAVKKALSSPIFVGTTAASLFSVILILYLFPLMSYKRELNETIDFLNDEKTFKNHKAKSSDQISSKIASLVKKKYNSEIELKEARLELNTEKELSRIAKSAAHDSSKIIEDVKTRIETFSKEPSKDNLDKINFSFNRIGMIFEDLKPGKLSKYSLRTNKTELCAISGLIQDIVDDQALEFLNIKFKSSIEKGLKAFCNANDLERVILNLVKNSTEAITSKGRIEVSASNKSDEVIIKVSDNGKGMPEDVIRFIFEENFTDEKKNGNGIGLYTVKNKVYSWLGKIDVESSPNKGTTFIIALKNENFTLKKNLKNKSIKDAEV